jgi:hypothetical protein
MKSQLTNDVGLASKFGIVSDILMHFLRSGHPSSTALSGRLMLTVPLSMASLHPSSPELDPSRQQKVNASGLIKCCIWLFLIIWHTNVDKAMKDKPILHSERPASNRRACKECFQALR